MTPLAHPGKLSLFVALSLADLALTRFLLERQGGGAYEWNPVASWWLARFGWAGLAGFKLGTVLLVAAVSVIVSRRRPLAAGRLLVFGCAALLAVIVHGGRLVPGVHAEAECAEQTDAQAQRLDRQLLRVNAYTNLTYQLGNDLVARRRSLGEAVDVLSAAEKARDPECLRGMALRYPGLTDRELLAVRLIEEACLSATGGAYGSAQVYRELNAQFRACFGRPAPRPALTWDEEVEGPS
jgi:hypothetical protein